MKILITNDDGVHAPGLAALLKRVSEVAQVVVVAPDQVEVTRGQLRSNGVLIAPDKIDIAKLTNRKSFNVALLGVLSNYLTLTPEVWRAAIMGNFPEKLHEANFQAFEVGRATKKI